MKVGDGPVQRQDSGRKGGLSIPLIGHSFFANPVLMRRMVSVITGRNRVPGKGGAR